MTIDRCACYNVSFATLKAEARASGAETISALQEEIDFGRDCGRCHPYIRRMLRTGETAFSEIIGEDGGEGSISSKLEW